MASADHPHQLTALDHRGCSLHCLKTSGRPYDLFERAVICLDDVVGVLARTVLRIERQLAFLLQTADGSRIRVELVCRH